MSQAAPNRRSTSKQLVGIMTQAMAAYCGQNGYGSRSRESNRVRTYTTLMILGLEEEGYVLLILRVMDFSTSTKG